MALLPLHGIVTAVTRQSLVRLLLVLNAFSLGSVVLIPILAESGTLDNSPPLKLILLPFMATWPFGPPLLLMVLFGLLGRSRRRTKIGARALAALLLYVPLVLFVVGYTISGRFVLQSTDAIVSAVAILLAMPLARFGFKSDGAEMRSPADPPNN